METVKSNTPSDHPDEIISDRFKILENGQKVFVERSYVRPKTEDEQTSEKLNAMFKGNTLVGLAILGIYAATHTGQVANRIDTLSGAAQEKAETSVSQNLDNVLHGKTVDSLIINFDSQKLSMTDINNVIAPTDHASAINFARTEITRELTEQYANTTEGMLITLAASEDGSKFTPDELQKYSGFREAVQTSDNPDELKAAIKAEALESLIAKIDSGKTITIPAFSGNGH